MGARTTNDAGLTARRAYGYGAAAGVLGRGLEVVCGFAQLWLLTRILDMETFGRYALTMTLVQLSALACATGLERLMIFRLSRDDAPAGQLSGHAFAGATLGLGLMLSVPLAVAMWLTAPAVASLFGDAALGDWLAGLAMLLPVTVTSAIYASWFQSRQRFAHAAVFSQAAPAATVVILLALVWLAGGDAGYVIAVSVVGPLLVLAAWWAWRPLNPTRLGVFSRSDLVYALKTTANGVLQKCLRHADVIMLGALAGASVVAVYVVALRFSRLLRMTHDLFGPVFGPRIGYLIKNNRRKQLIDEFELVRLASLVCTLLVLIPLAAFGPTVLGWFGDYEAAYPLLLLLMGVALTPVVFGKTGILLNMTGHAGWLLAANFGLLVLNITLNAALIPIWGATGAAVATLVAIIAIQTLNVLLIRKLNRMMVMSGELTSILIALLLTLFAASADLIAPGLAAFMCVVVLTFLVLAHRDLIKTAASLLRSPLAMPNAEN